jgi:GNAT superfamily N-acetyltransferase
VTDAERALAFSRRLCEGRAGRVERYPWGTGVFTDDLPRIYDLNYVYADRVVGEAEVDEAMAHCRHRKVVVHDPELPDLPLEWPLKPRYLVMALRRGPDSPAERPVREVDAETYERFRTPFAAVPEIAELPARTARVVDVRFFCAFESEEPVAACELYRHGDVAQVEDVFTLEAYRGRGHARAVVLAAVEAAAGADLVFLFTDESETVWQLYEKLGFETIGVERMWVRLP